MKPKKNIWLITLAITFALALFASCIRKADNYYPGQFVPQANNYYLGPSVSVLTGTLASKTIITTGLRGNCLTEIYVLNTACPINVSNANVLNDCSNITVNNISMFQLAGYDLNLSPYIGRQVRLTGKFFLGCAEDNYNQLLMEVCKLEIYNTVPASQCQPVSQCPTTQNTLPANQCASVPPPAAQKPPPKKTVQATQCPPTKTYRIQVGAFCNSANAHNVMTQLQRQNLCPVKEKYLQYTRVMLRGISANRVESTVAAVRRAGFDETWIQPE
jgi:hypothetical protein